MLSLGVPEILIGALLFAGLAWAVYNKLNPDSGKPRYDFETW